MKKKVIKTKFDLAWELKLKNYNKYQVVYHFLDTFSKKEIINLCLEENINIYK